MSEYFVEEELVFILAKVACCGSPRTKLSLNRCFGIPKLEHSGCGVEPAERFALSGIFNTSHTIILV
jgi:hypothetical protein